MATWKHLDPASFRRALARGLGRCVQHLREGGDPTPHREALLDAFRRNLAYDPQCEGTRTQYLFDLAEAAGMLGDLRREALSALPGCDEKWDVDQHSAVALAFARDGDARAAAALRSCLDAAAPSGEAFDGLAWAVIQLDGAGGLARAARLLGRDRRVDHHASTLSYLRSVARDVAGAEAVEAALASAAADDAEVAALVEATRALDARDAERAPREHLPLEALIEQARSYAARGARFMGHFGWARRASSDEIQAAADRLSQAREPWLQRLLLRVFSRVTYPGPLATLLRLADAPDEGVRHDAMRALSTVAAPEVRALLWSSLAGEPPRWGAIRLLDANYQPGDGDRVAPLLERVALDSDDLVHSIGFDLFEAFGGEGRGDDVVRPFVWLYEHTPCSQCREDAVRKLIDHGALRGALADECAWDCNDEIRERVADALGPDAG